MNIFQFFALLILLGAYITLLIIYRNEFFGPNPWYLINEKSLTGMPPGFNNITPPSTSTSPSSTPTTTSTSPSSTPTTTSTSPSSTPTTTTTSTSPSSTVEGYKNISWNIPSNNQVVESVQGENNKDLPITAIDSIQATNIINDLLGNNIYVSNLYNSLCCTGIECSDQVATYLNDVISKILNNFSVINCHPVDYEVKNTQDKYILVDFGIHNYVNFYTIQLVALINWTNKALVSCRTKTAN